MPIFHSVSMEDYQYPCMIYVTKRLGIKRNIYFLWDFDAELYKPGSDNKLKPGDILLWVNSNSKPQNMPIVMNEHGLLSLRVYRNKHFGVYEGDDIVSDCDINGVIHTRIITDLDFPTGIIRYEKIKEYCMPLIKPKKDETRNDFVRRFMKTPESKEWPTQDQRLAVAYDIYEKAKKKRRHNK